MDRDPTHRDNTRDPIFLLQTVASQAQTGDAASSNEWRTESVFLTRDEAESFARSRAYRWSSWRVYCVPCEGALAQVLNQNTGHVASAVE